MLCNVWMRSRQPLKATTMCIPTQVTMTLASFGAARLAMPGLGFMICRGHCKKLKNGMSKTGTGRTKKIVVIYEKVQAPLLNDPFMYPSIYEAFLKIFHFDAF